MFCLGGQYSPIGIGIGPRLFAGSSGTGSFCRGSLCRSLLFLLENQCVIWL